VKYILILLHQAGVFNYYDKFSLNQGKIQKFESQTFLYVDLCSND